MSSDAFGSVNLADTADAASQDVSTFLHQTWNPFVEVYRAVSGLQEDDAVPEPLVGLHDEDVEAMIKDGSVLEKRFNAALSAIAGP